MNVRFKKTNKGEVAILPRKEYEVLAAKAREADEAFGTARLVARARKQIADGILLIPKQIIDRIRGVTRPAAKRLSVHGLHQAVRSRPHQPF